MRRRISAPSKETRCALAGSGQLASEGRFRFERLPNDRTLAVVVSAPGFVTSRSPDLSPPFLASDDDVVLRLPEGGVIVGSVLDAMGRGLPVVASEVPGNIDLVKHGETGLLVPPRDGKAMGQAILRLLGDEAERGRLGDAGRALILREHRLDDFIRAIEDLYRGG